MPTVDPVEPLPLTGRPELRADCGRCAGLCCVALPFARSADFAFSKDAGVPCRHLATDHACTIHDRLRPEGFGGCAVYDCFGAGQRVVQGTYAGRDWRSHPGTSAEMLAVFPVVRHLHELLWYLDDALALPAVADLHLRLQAAYDATDELASARPRDLLAADLPAHRAHVGELLTAVSAMVRAAAPGRPRDLRGADLVGARLRAADLRGARLRGALLIAADLREADLAGADVLGADLRDADVRGADLSRALFLNPMQAAAARGDQHTRLPTRIPRPARW